MEPDPPPNGGVRGDAEDTATRWGDVTRLTCDIGRGSYNYLTTMVAEVNAHVQPGAKRMTISRLVRGPIGSMIAEHKRVVARKNERRVRAS